MPSAAERLEFAPPRDTGNLRAFGLALLAHVLLIAALTWGVNWKRSDQTAAFEAELWTSVPQEAAPPLAEAPPPPPPPAPPPAPEVRVAPPTPNVDIALEQEKKRKLLQQQKEVEAQKAAEKLKAELQAKKEKEKERELKAREDLAQRKAAEELKKAEAKKQEAKEQAQQKQAQAAAEKQRQENMRRIAGLVGATGSAEAKGSAQKAGGPSAGYGGKVRAAVKPNVVFTEDIAGNPQAEVEVRTTPDGTIMSQRLVKPSGNKAWDDAVIKAIIRTGTLPRDVDGRVPSPMILEFRPKD